MAEKVLSIFVDESGTFGNCESYEDRYMVGLVFHDQSVDISSNIANFKSHLIEGECLSAEKKNWHYFPLSMLHREANQIREIPGLNIRKIGFISVNGFEEKEEGYSCYEGKDLYR